MISEKHILERIAHHLGLMANRINQASTIAQAVPDTSALKTLAVALQDEFDIILHQRDMDPETTVKDLVDLIMARVVTSESRYDTSLF